MPVESAFDRSAFVSDAAVTVIYKNQGTRYTMRGIFDSDYQGVNVADPEFASDQPQITLPTSALPFSHCKAIRSTITKRSTTSAISEQMAQA